MLYKHNPRSISFTQFPIHPFSWSAMSSIVNLPALSASQSLSSLRTINKAVPNFTYHIQTLWLFIKSDIVGIIMPIVSGPLFEDLS